MAYPPRQYEDGCWYHVYARSLDEVRMFESDDERRWFINQLDDVLTRRKVTLGALCLMDTHYHALVQMGPVPLDRALNGLHMSYTKHTHDTRNREGPLFRDRPGEDRILDDDYLLQVVPYIHQNPVKANMVEHARDWEWSTDEWYRTGEWSHGDLDCLAFPPHFRGKDRVRVYQERMDEPLEQIEGGDGYIGTEQQWEDLDRRDETRSGRYRDRRGRATMDEIAQAVTEDYDVEVSDLKQPGRSQPAARLRQEAMVRMYEEGYGPTEIGDYFNRNKGAVVYAVNSNKS